MTTITLEPTPQIVRLSERPARIWIGHTAGGAAVQAFVSGIAVERTENQAELERALIEQSPLAFHGIPLQAGLDMLKVRQGWRSLCQRCGLTPETATPELIEGYVVQLQARIDPATASFPLESALARYGAQEREWQTIKDELIAAREGQSVTAHQVTLEQDKRMLARGQRRVRFEELCPRRHGTNETLNPLPEPPKDPTP